MPLLDVSIVVTSAYLIDAFAVMRRKEVVNDFGISQITPSLLSGYGIVYATTEDELKRYPDLQIQGKAITVITQFPLRGESKADDSYQPDVVQWNGDNFVVRALDDYSLYGQGYIFAICSSIDLVDQFPLPAGTGGFGVGEMGNRGMGE